MRRIWSGLFLERRWDIWECSFVTDSLRDWSITSLLRRFIVLADEGSTCWTVDIETDALSELV